MSDWKFAQEEAPTDLALLHFFSIVKKEPAGDVEFRITVKEFAKPTSRPMSFFAQADKQTNQKTMAITPAGWGDSLLAALSECITEIHRFPYEGPR
jgi:hypothetical protein